MKPSRRQMLQSALAGAAGIAGFGAFAKGAPHAVLAGRSIGDSLGAKDTVTFAGRNWHVVVEGQQAGHGPAPGDRMSVYGELVDGGGAGVGEFFGSCVCLTPFGGEASATTVETHTLRLKDGTIHGMGTTTPGPEHQAEFAVVGGTGRFAGAQGSYVVRQHPIELGGDGSAQLTLTFVA
jgi:hypothetical protein